MTDDDIGMEQKVKDEKNHQEGPIKGYANTTTMVYCIAGTHFDHNMLNFRDNFDLK